MEEASRNPKYRPDMDKTALKVREILQTQLTMKLLMVLFQVSEISRQQNNPSLTSENGRQTA
jgi:hypothetical protein